MKKNKAMQLVRALRSGGYEQGVGRLVSNNDEFCCLGVVCNISKTDLEWEEDPNWGWKIGDDYTLILPTKIQDEFGFYTKSGNRSDHKRIEINGKEYLSLLDANDGGVSFADLADYLEQNWEQL